MPISSRGALLVITGSLLLLAGAGCPRPTAPVSTPAPAPSVKPDAKEIQKVLNKQTEADQKINPKNSPEKLTFMLHVSHPYSAVLSVFDANGNEISPTTSSYRGASFRTFGVVQYITVPPDTARKVVITGRERDSFSLDIEGRGDGVDVKTTFEGIPSSSGTHATVSFADGRAEHVTLLKVDEDGDGTIDLTLDPVLNGIARIPPVVPNYGEVISFDPQSVRFSIGRAGHNDAMVIPASATSTVIVEDEGHWTTVEYSKNVQEPSQAFLTVSAISRDVYPSGQSLVKLRYYSLMDAASSTPSVFLAHIQTQGGAIIAFYQEKTDETWMYFPLRDKDDDADLAVLAREITFSARSLRKVYKGFRMPIVTVYQGYATLNYKEL